ncbi:MAG: hypothetical protein ISS83_00060 [Candidatus Pacebacteria bacterium]|nr:hypothetical protein [Candidatus Paceibacterota bacterium]
MDSTITGGCGVGVVGCAAGVGVVGCAAGGGVAGGTGACCVQEKQLEQQIATTPSIIKRQIATPPIIVVVL